MRSQIFNCTQDWQAQDGRRGVRTGGRGVRRSSLTEQLILLLVELVDALGVGSQPVELRLHRRLCRLGAVQLLLCDLLLVHRVQVLLLQTPRDVIINNA